MKKVDVHTQVVRFYKIWASATEAKNEKELLAAYQEADFKATDKEDLLTQIENYCESVICSYERDYPEYFDSDFEKTLNNL